ncbi:MAG: hypothetical protein QOK35_867 [Pseudonocardiales bacterium]|jgi:AcrR family transcriptional regulator|nr:hypothetical protein [Pseudonocardiales bacterium]
MTSPVRATRPGGRTARVRAAVLEAVAAELCDRGFDGLSVDGVAARAGVHRATVYRRWRDVGGLLADTLAAARQAPWEPPDTGSLETDLVAINREVHTALSGGSPVTLALIGASFRSAEAASALREFWADRLHRGEAVVRRAALRGEIRDGVDPHQVIVAATAPLYYGVVLLRDVLSAAVAEDYARIAARAFRR